MAVLLLLAVVIADTPGIGNTLIFFLMHSLMRIRPGSDKVGVPASEIIETKFLNTIND